ncbi:MAG: GNAT family protein [Bacteroidota bacterium]
MKEIVLPAKQIVLRDWKQKDLTIYQYWFSGRKRWMDFDAPYFQKPPAELVQKRILKLEQRIATHDWPVIRERLVIAEMKNDQLIGTVNWYWQSKVTHWKSIGIAIYDKHYWGNGIGKEALQLWIDYLFTECQEIVRLDLRTWSGNERMINLSRKLGFTEEARFRKARIVDGIYYDSIGMGLLREEWQNHKEK